MQPNGPMTSISVTTTVFALKYVTYSIAVIHGYEWVCTLSFEFGHIWRKPPSSIIKWQYLVSRYLGVTAQICNAIFISLVYSTSEIPRHICIRWYTGQIFIGQTILLLLEISLIHRLFALYDRDTRILGFLVALIGVEYISVVSLGMVTVQKMHFFGTCISKAPHMTVIYMSVVQLVPQLVIWTLTLLKCGGRKIPVLSLVIRDGSWVFGAMLVSIVAAITNVFFANYKIDTTRLYYAAFPFYAAIITCANCRLIMNMEGMPETEQTTSSSIVLSSFFYE